MSAITSSTSAVLFWLLRARPPTESTTLYVMVSNTGSTDTETVSVAITVEDAPSLDELPAGDEMGMVVENVAGVAGGTPLITGITPTATLTNPTWVIREAVPAGLDFLVKRLEIVSGTGGTFNLVLSSGEMLDHEAIPGGVLNLHVWAVENGVRSNALEIAITVTDANDAPVFLNAVLNPALDYSPEIAETTAIGTEIARVGARDADGDSVTYAITGGNDDGAFSHQRRNRRDYFAECVELRHHPCHRNLHTNHHGNR